jgi:Tfp pilus assembly protein PilF
MNPLRKINFGMKLLSQGQVKEAAQISSKLLATEPDVAPVYALACEVALAQNQIGQALSFINRAIEIDRQQPEFQIKKAWVEVMSRQGLRAQDTASALAIRFPGEPAIQLEAARVLAESGNHAAAEPMLMNAKARDGKNPDILFEFAKNQIFLGKTAEAEMALEENLKLNLPLNGRKLLLRSKLRKQTKENNHVEMLKNYLARPLQKKEAVNCYFALAKELEDLGEYAQSFKALQSGAAIQSSLVDFNLVDELKNLTAIIETFTPENYERIADSPARDAPVFIVGMPRTGTTLVERIIGRCEGVSSAEETNDFTAAMSSVINDYLTVNEGRDLNPLTAALEVDYGEIAHIYRNSLIGMLGASDHYLDKTPFNFLYCGLIAKAFPNARILHIVRDPMDTCYAIFKTLFNQSYFFSYDLEVLTDYYMAYRKLMDHWCELIPNSILEVRYEELVSNPLDVSKQIADFVGLPWHKDMIQVQDSSKPCSTASAMQVREPINRSSVGLWRRYEAELQPVIRKLSAAKIVDEEGRPLGGH